MRIRSEGDRRQVKLELTEEGVALTRRSLPIVIEAQNQVLENVSRDDYRTLSTLLRRIAGEDMT